MVMVVVLVSDRLVSDSVKRCRPLLLWARLVSPAVSAWLVLVLSTWLAADTAIAANCDLASGAAAVSACEKELARDPTSIEVRLRYADVLMGRQQYQKAVNILKDALAIRPDNEKVKRKYRLASSLAEEQKVISQEASKAPAAGTRNSLNEILCKTVKGQKAIDACGRVLTSDPGNVTALTRRGDELMALNQVEDAVLSYRRAVTLDPADSTLKNKLVKAESKIPKEPRVVVVEAPITEVPIIDEATIAAEKKRKKEEIRLALEKNKKEAERKRQEVAERKREEEAKKILLARQAQKTKEEELKAKLQATVPEVVARYSNTPLANGSTY